MFHRHLTHDKLTLAAIDSIIERGARKDWMQVIRRMTAICCGMRLMKVCRRIWTSQYLIFAL